MSVILSVSGFGEFAGVRENPTTRLVERLQKQVQQDGLPGLVVADTRVVRTSAVDATAEVQKIWTALRAVKSRKTEGEVAARVAVHLGVDSGASHVKLEQVAWNDASFRVPDEAGAQPNQTRIDPDCGSRTSCLFTRLDCQAVADTVNIDQRRGSRVELSKDAGRFVCNYIFFRSLGESDPARGASVPDASDPEVLRPFETSLFIHVPPFEVLGEDEQYELIVKLLRTVSDNALLCAGSGTAREATANAPTETWLVFGGATGWIGGMVMALLAKEDRVREAEEDSGQGQPRIRAVAAQSRLEDRAAVALELAEVQPTYIVNAAGLTGRPNVDWCETHQAETNRANVLGALTLVDVAWELFGNRVPVLVFGTGCLYKYDEQHPMPSVPTPREVDFDSTTGFSETDRHSFSGSVYSRGKSAAETAMREYENVLIFRVRLPLNDDIRHPRNLVKKITTYAKVINIPNSITIVNDVLPIALEFTRRGKRGVFNATNPGVVSHNEILELYQKHIDPSFTIVNFSEEEQAEVIAAERSNCMLDTRKLRVAAAEAGLAFPEIHDSLNALFLRARASLHSFDKKHQ